MRCSRLRESEDLGSLGIWAVGGFGSFRILHFGLGALNPKPLGLVGVCRSVGAKGLGCRGSSFSFEVWG